MKREKAWVSEKKLLKLIEGCKIPNVSHDYWWGDTLMFNVADNDYKVYFELSLPVPPQKPVIGGYTPSLCKPTLLKITWDRKSLDKVRWLPVQAIFDWEDGTGPEFKEAQDALIKYFGSNL